MVFFRLFGLSLIIFCVIALVVDKTKSLSADKLVITQAGEQWFNLHPQSLNSIQVVIERYIHPLLWDPVMITILQWPTWVVLGLIGVLFYAIGYKRKKKKAFMN